MTPFGKWLAEIGLGRYDQVFVADGIDFDVIRSLSDADLRELGLTLGDRKRLLQAVARLDEQPPDTVIPAVASAMPSEPLREDAGGERRQLWHRNEWPLLRPLPISTRGSNWSPPCLDHRNETPANWRCALALADVAGLKGWAAPEVWTSLHPALALAKSVERHDALRPSSTGLTKTPMRKGVSRSPCPG